MNLAKAARRSLFNDDRCNPELQLYCAWSLLLFMLVGLGADALFVQKYFDGRVLTTCFTLLHFSAFFVVADSFLKRLMFVMVPLSYIGELLFCKVFEMYDYRTPAIPFYVPFGHAILYASGYVFARTAWALKNEIILRKIFISFFVLLFVGAGVFLDDVLTLAFGLLFFLVVRRKRWQNLYFFIACAVVVLELVGTYFQCWTWRPRAFSVISTANPPMGAVFIYAGGDLILLKIVSTWIKRQAA